MSTKSSNRRTDYTKVESEFREAQDKWADDPDDKNAYWIMWKCIQLAVFNCMNKALEGKLPEGEIEERSLDITCNVMSQIIRKRAKGKQWKVGKLSSYVYLPCLHRYNERWRMWDEMIFF